MLESQTLVSRKLGNTSANEVMARGSLAVIRWMSWGSLLEVDGSRVSAVGDV